GESETRKRRERIIRHDRPMVDKFLKFGRGVLALVKREIGLSARIRRIECSALTVLGIREGKIVGNRVLQNLDRRVRTAALKLNIAPRDGQPIMIHRGIEGMLHLQVVCDRASTSSVAAARECYGGQCLHIACGGERECIGHSVASATSITEFRLSKRGTDEI